MAEIKSRFCSHGPQSHHPGCRHDPSTSRDGAQRRLPGFPEPQGMAEARQRLDDISKPVYGPERRLGDYSVLRQNPAAERRRRFDEGRGKIVP